MADPLTSKIVIHNQRGLHARASAKFVKCAEQFNAKVKVSRGENTVHATSIMGLMLLAAGPGTEIIITASGKQADKALKALTKLVSDGFGE